MRLNGCIPISMPIPMPKDIDIPKTWVMLRQGAREGIGCGVGVAYPSPQKFPGPKKTAPLVSDFWPMVYFDI